MNEQLQAKISEYQESLQSLREEGQSLSLQLKQEGWEFVDSLLECDREPCAVHPDLWADLAANEDIIFDDEQDFTYFGRDLTEDEWKMVVELSVF
jgi:hypothetical protein